MTRYTNSRSHGECAATSEAYCMVTVPTLALGVFPSVLVLLYSIYSWGVGVGVGGKNFVDYTKEFYKIGKPPCPPAPRRLRPW